MLTCPSCSHENNDEAKFCEECGTITKLKKLAKERETSSMTKEDVRQFL